MLQAPAAKARGKRKREGEAEKIEKAEKAASEATAQIHCPLTIIYLQELWMDTLFQEV
jgi:hypothetical protein